MRVFLCHSSQDKAVVRQLYQELSNNGFDVWLDEEKLLPGQDWNREIVLAIRNSDIVVICLSGSSITKSGYVQKEIKFALDAADEKPDGAIFLIPAKLEECIVPERLVRFQWVNLFESNGYLKLIKSLHFAESKKEEVNNIALDTNTKIQMSISDQEQSSQKTSRQISHVPQLLTVLLRSTGDSEADRQRISDIYNILISYHGDDRFSFQIFENNSGYLIDFPDATTHVCDDLLIKLHSALGLKSPWRVEELSFR
jgi:hypothetical protein